MSKQDTHTRLVELFDDAKEAIEDQYQRMREDARFSNPADPQQWDKSASELRKGRPCLTFDRTNQFISQVVNTARQNKPAIHCLPADSKADIDVAEQLNGVIRHIEYVSRAGITYDTAIEHAARVGLGWMRIVPEIMRPETNEQEIRIKRIADPMTCYLEAGWLEPDGSDARSAFIETMMPRKAFERRWPKAETDSWERSTTGWFDDKQVRICETFEIIETKENLIKVDMSAIGMPPTVMSEQEYWDYRKQTGMKLPAEPFEAKTRSVKWSHLSGCEVLEEADFPSQFLPLIPVIGHELIVDGKRHLCGMTRRLMDSQRAYNYERSAFIESVAMQPKAPLMTPVEAMEGLEAAYAGLNQGNPSVLPYNHQDEAGQPIPAPIRLNPPAFPAAFAQGGQIASTDMESAVGMFRANLGAPGAAVSGRAKREDKVAGDTANFHYTDNLARSIEQLGRVIVDMIPRVYDTARQARIVGQDGKQDFVSVNPDMQEPVQKRGKKVVAINPSVGNYDVRVKTGPAYTTLREEQAEQLAHIMQAAPMMVPILADLWVSAQDFPDAEKATKRLSAMLPPNIQQMEHDEGEDIPPAVMGMLQQKDAELAQVKEALTNAYHEHMDLENQVKAGTQAKMLEAQAKEKAAAEQAQRDRQAAQEAFQREVAIKHGEDEQLRRDNAMKERIAKMQAESAERIAALNRELKLAELQVSTMQAEQARQAEAVLEGKRMALEQQKQATEIQFKQKQDADAANEAKESQKAEGEKTDKTAEVMAKLAESHGMMAKALDKLSKPKKLIMDKNGNPVGAAHVD